MMELIVNLISGAFIFSGCLFVIVGAIGLIRMPDLYTRVHAASLTDTGGILFIIIGLVLQAVFIFDNPMAAIKLILVVIFLFLTAPTASHAVTKAALMANMIPRCQNGKSVVDESLSSLYHGFSDTPSSEDDTNVSTNTNTKSAIQQEEPPK